MKNREVIYYLKINSDNDKAYDCLQFWINIAKINQSDFYILCDNQEIKERLIQRCQNGIISDISPLIISSMRDELDDISKVIASEFWQNASNAHLTSFLHSKKMGVNFFWNIDADDTIFLENEGKIAQLLKNVEIIAFERDIDILSLDMWYSFHQKIKGAWTFGVSFVNSLTHDWINEIKSHMNDERLISWWDENKKEKNVDSFFFFLRNVWGYSIESFYLNDTKFIHLKTIWGPLVYRFSNGQIKIPVHMAILLFKDKQISQCEILDEVIRIDLDTEQSLIWRNKKNKHYLSNTMIIYFPVLYKVKQMGFINFLRKSRDYIKRKIRNLKL